MSTPQKNAFSYRSWPGPDSCVHSPFPMRPCARFTGRTGGASLRRQTTPGPNRQETMVERRRFSWRRRQSMPPGTAMPRATEQKSDGEPTRSGPRILSHLRTFLDGKLLHSTDGRLSRQSGKLSREQRSASPARGDFSRLSTLAGVVEGSLIERSRRFLRFTPAGDARGFHAGVRTFTPFEKPERL